MQPPSSADSLSPTSDSPLANAVRLCAEGILVVSSEGVIQFANPAAAALLGLETDQAVGEQFGLPAATEAPTIVMLRRPGQAAARVEMRAAEIEWEGELAYVVNLHDVSAKVDAFDKAQRLASVVEASDDAIYGKRLDGTITSWNAGAERIFGYTAEEMIGANVDQLVPDDLESDEPMLLQKLQAGERIEQYVTVRQTKCGERRYVSLTISPIFDQDGKRVGASSVARDVTEARQQRLKLQRRTHELQERVKEQACMYACCKAANEATDLTGLVRSVVETIPRGFQFPELISARVQLDEHRATSKAFRESRWQLREDIVVDGERRGYIEVFSGEAEGGAIEGAFLAEEQSLLAALADVLSHTCTRLQSHLHNVRLNEVLSAIQHVNQLIVRETDRGKLIRHAVELLVESRAFVACWLVLMEENRVSDHAHAGLSAEDAELLLKHYNQGHTPVCLSSDRNTLCRVVEALGEPCANCPLRQVTTSDAVLTAALCHGEKRYGFIAVYVAAHVVDDSQEIALVEEVADDLSLAMHTMDMREEVVAAAQRNAAILSSISDAFFAMDDKLVVTYFNAAAEKILERPYQEVVGRALYDSLPRFKDTLFESRLQQVLETHEPDHFEIHLAVAPHDEWYDVRVYPQAHGISVYLQVTTEQKKAERALRRSLELLNETGDMARIGGWDIDLETNKVLWTRTTRKIHEVDADFEPDVAEAIAFYAPEARPKITKAVERARQEGIPYDLEVPFITAKGNRLWVRAVGKPKMVDGRCVRLQGIFQDVTERKQAEEALREAKLKLETALAAGHIGLWDWDLETHEVEYSAEWKRQLGYAEDELEDEFETWQSRVHSEDLEATIDAIQQAIQSASDDSFHVEFRLRHKDGSYRWILSQAAILRDEDGKGIRALGSHTDVSDLHAAEEERLHLATELQQAQKMDSVGRLAGGVAHDFNNKLSVILGFSQLAMMKMDAADPLYPRLEQISKAAESAADLTRQLLAFARKQTIDPKVIDLNDLVAGMLKMLGRLIGEDIRLIWEPCQGLGRTKMDPGQLDQILANLVVNARDAIGGVGTITITTRNAEFDVEAVQSHPDAQPGPYVALSVSDTGCGMDEETLTQVFEPFFTTKAQGEGTGLGLSTVYGAVRQNNGFIDVVSEPGEGTTFRIYLPRLIGDGAIDEELEETVVIPAGTETVLLVEDEAPLLELVIVLLEEAGYTVLAAETPAKAMKLARDHADEIELLLTDVVMPEMNGRELLIAIHEIIPGLKCLFMSGYTANVIAHRGVLEKEVHFVQKPFQSHVLGKKVREILDNAKPCA